MINYWRERRREGEGGGVETERGRERQPRRARIPHRLIYWRERVRERESEALNFLMTDGTGERHTFILLR